MLFQAFIICQTGYKRSFYPVQNTTQSKRAAIIPAIRRNNCYEKSMQERIPDRKGRFF